MAAGHVEAVLLHATENEVRATLRQADEADGLAGGVEDLHAIEIFRLCAGGTIAAPAAPNIAVHIDLDAVEAAIVVGRHQRCLVRQLDAVGTDVIAPDDAVGRCTTFDDVELLLVRGECKAFGP